MGLFDCIYTKRFYPYVYYWNHCQVMETRPTCPDLVNLSKTSNSNLLLKKTEADIQRNYDTMFNSINAYKSYFQKKS